MNSADLAKIDTILTINSEGLPLYFFNIPGFPDDSQNIKFLEFGKTYLFSSNSVGYNLCTDLAEVTTTEPPVRTFQYISAINTRANVLGSPRYGHSVSASYNGGCLFGISAPFGTDPITGAVTPYYYVARSTTPGVDLGSATYVNALNDPEFIYGNPQANGIIHLHGSFVFTSKDYFKTEIRHINETADNPTLVNGIVRSSTESSNGIVYFLAYGGANSLQVYSLLLTSQGEGTNLTWQNTVTPYGSTINLSSLTMPTATDDGYWFVPGSASGAYYWKISNINDLPVLYGTVTYQESSGTNNSRTVTGLFKFDVTSLGGSSGITTIRRKLESEFHYDFMFDVTRNFYAVIDSNTTWSSTSRLLTVKNLVTDTEDTFDFPLLGDVDLDTGWYPIDIKFRNSYIFLLDMAATQPRIQRIRVYYYNSTNSSLTHEQTIEIPFTWPTNIAWDVDENAECIVISDQYYNNSQGRVIFYKKI